MQAYILITTAPKEIKNVTAVLHISGAAISDSIELLLTDNSIGVNEIRSFIDQLRLSPTAGQIRLGVIRSAQSLTPEAQNALLKSLEEPPPRVIIVLETSTITALLPTVLSRCQIVTDSSTTPEAETVTSEPNILRLLPLSVGEQLAATENIGQSKQDVTTWMEAAQHDIHSALLSAYGLQQSIQSTISPSHIAIVGKKLLKAYTYLQANVTPRLVLDSIFLTQNESVDNQEFIV